VQQDATPKGKNALLKVTFSCKTSVGATYITVKIKYENTLLP
jgi:hypothetical protein